MSFCNARRAVAAIFVLASASLCTGCGDTPKPFAHTSQEVRTLTLPNSDPGGVTVLRVFGVDEAQSEALVGAMAAALGRRDIPAATDGGNRRSRYIEATGRIETVRPGIRRLRIIWDLFDRTGETFGKATTDVDVAAADLAAPTAKRLQPYLEPTADRLSAFLVRPAGAGRSPRHSGMRLHVWPVVGAPPGGDKALRAAMQSALRRRAFTVVDDLETARLIVAGTVMLGKPASNRQPIEISWAVLHPDGREIGALSQKNAVPADSLGSDWGRLAGMIAEAAAGGVSEMIRRLSPEALKTGDSVSRRN